MQRPRERNATSMKTDLIGLALTLLYAPLCVVFVVIWARPGLLRRWRIPLPPRFFAPSRVHRLRELWRDLVLSASALALFAYEEGAFSAALGLLMLALAGLAAQALGDDLLANGPTTTPKPPTRLRR